MHPISHLLDPEFAKKYFIRHILPKYKNFQDIDQVAVKPRKNHIWTTTFHVVIEFDTIFVNAQGKKIILPIFCTAHSEEPRKNVYLSLKFLRKNSFSTGSLTVPRPLYYSREFRAVFYRGFTGQNLNELFWNQDFTKIEEVVKLSARWLAKLHAIPTNKNLKLNAANSRIKTALPGASHIIRKIGQILPDKKNQVEKIYKILMAQEAQFMGQTEKLWLMHGDFHPENIISFTPGKIGIIDFADFSLGDFARDLGCFLKQYKYMGAKHAEGTDFIARTSDTFLSEYVACAKIELSGQLKNRIETYYNWTAIRNAIYFAMRHNPKREQSRHMIEKIARRMNL